MRLIDNYSTYLCSISELSWDKDRGISFIQDDEKSHRMYNFDGIKKTICKKIRGEKNFSCDAYWEKNSKKYFIEFKNQAEGNISRENLWNKAYDSAAMVLVNENITREELAQKAVLIIVYDNQRHIPDASSYNPSESMDKFTQKLKGFAKLTGVDQLPVKFGLDKFNGILYREVHTLGVEDFKKFFYPVLFDI